MIGRIRIDRPVLVVDDTNSTRYSTVRILRASGVEVLEATTGQQALDLASHCGAVVLDVNLPDMDGFEVCQRLRAEAANAHVPVVHLSAQRLRDEDKIRGLESGADAYLTHPVEPGMLVATLNALLRARAAEHAELRSRVRFEAMFRTAPVGIALLSAAGELRDGNRELHRIFGVDGEDASALAGHVQALASQCAASHAGGGRDATVATLSDSGGPRYVDCRVAELDEDTRMLIVVDTTAKHMLEMERERLLQSERDARREAEEASRAKDSFLALLSHELRNPLAPISSAAKLLQMAPGEPSVTERASEVIVRQVRHMTELVDDLMDVSRVTRGLVELEKAVLDVRGVLDAAVEQVRPLLEARRQRFHMAAPDEPVAVEGDRTRLVQVVANLLNNAAKYSADGSRIDLDLRREDEQVVIRVRDNGLGISTALLPHIFELFTQAERTPDRSQGGLGIGLALVRSVVRLHGGEVRAESPGEGQGSTFTVTLPRSHAAIAPADERTLTGRRFRSLEVLVVDDNVDGAQTLAEVLRIAGHRVRVVHHAEAALEVVRDSEVAFDVFLLDIGLPGMTGYALSERLRADPRARNAVFVALTGYGQSSDYAQSLAAGFDCHLVKPVRELELLETIGSLALPPAGAGDAPSPPATR